MYSDILKKALVLKVGNGNNQYGRPFPTRGPSVTYSRGNQGSGVKLSKILETQDSPTRPFSLKELRVADELNEKAKSMPLSAEDNAKVNALHDKLVASKIAVQSATDLATMLPGSKAINPTTVVTQNPKALTDKLSSWGYKATATGDEILWRKSGQKTIGVSFDDAKTKATAVIFDSSSTSKSENHMYAKVLKGNGNNQYKKQFPTKGASKPKLNNPQEGGMSDGVSGGVKTAMHQAKRAIEGVNGGNLVYDDGSGGLMSEVSREDLPRVTRNLNKVMENAGMSPAGGSPTKQKWEGKSGSAEMEWSNDNITVTFKQKSKKGFHYSLANDIGIPRGK